MHRQREDASCQAFCYGEVAVFIARVEVCFLLMQGNRIVDHSGYAAFCQAFPQLIPVDSYYAQRILMEHMRRVGFSSGNEQFLIVGESLVVIRSGALACCRVGVQVRQFGISYSSLDAVQTTVHAHFVMMITYVTTMVGNGLHPVG